MTFEALYIKSFGKLRDKTIAFAEGVNILEGGNESGKSTVCAFIQFMFYGLPKQEKKRYISWETSLAAGTLTFFDNGGHYRIEREAILATSADGKEYIREKCAVYDADTNTVFSKTRSPGELFFGVSASVFESTVYIRQTADSKIGGSALGEEAENILFSGNEKINTGKAIEKLDKARVFLLHKNHKGGKISELEDARNSLEDQLEQAKTAGGDIISLEGSLRRLQEEKDSTEARLSVLRTELAEYEKYSVKKAYLQRRSEKERLAATEAKLDALYQPPEHDGVEVASLSYIEMLEKKQSALSLAMSRYNDVKKELDEANRKISDMSEKLDIFERIGAKDEKRRDALVERMEQNQKNMQRCNLFGIIFAVLAVISIAVALIFRKEQAFPEILKYLCVTCCLLFAALSAYLIFFKKAEHARAIQAQCKHFNCTGYAEFKELVKAASEDEAYMLFIRGTRDEKTEKFNRVSNSLDAISSEILAILRKARFDISENTSVSLSEALEKCRAMHTQITALEASASEQKIRIETIEEELSAYSKEYLRGAYYAEYDEEAMAKFNYNWKKKEFETLSATKTGLSDRIHQIELELTALRAVNDDPTALAEEVAALEAEIETLSHKWSAYMLAMEAMDAASGKLREGISPKIAKNAGKLLGAMTDGKYTELGLDTEFLMRFSDGSSMRDASLLSAGTGDLAYICLRIALIDLLYKKSVPPFLFDESFVRMDDGRMKKLLALIHKYAGVHYQSVIFTCHTREKEAMAEIGQYHLLSI
ncbi:MAG: AAA family ATPase [Clostridia bacterium]|nr:AAA family ATPase [Clostridia bacterium]